MAMLSGLLFEKDKSGGLKKRVLDFFERVRYAYLSAREDPKEYGPKWKKTVKEVRDKFDNLDDFTRELKKYLTEKVAFSDDAYDPNSLDAKEIYEAVKEMRFKSDKVSDPYSKQLGDEVIDTLLEHESIFVGFIHYALRAHANALPEKVWEKHNLKPDEISQGAMGLDLEVKDIPIYITEHYGDEKTDTRRIKSKFKGAYALLEKIFLDEYSDENWESLQELDISKEEKSEEEKSEIDFIVPNKPMYRIFELDDLKEVKGLSGEFVVQEKYDGMRIQIHKIGDKIKIFTYNNNDITEKCSEQVEQMKKKHFGDCILDAELMLFNGDEPLHRADTIKHVFKKETEGRLRAHAFDIMNHDGKDISDETLRERINILFYQYSQHSSDELAFPSKKDTRIADSIKEVGSYAKDIMDLPASEGVVIKDIESTYYIGNKKNPKWIKWKKFVDLDVIVLTDKKTKNKLHSYTVGIGPVNADTARNYKTVEFEDKDYLPLGKVLNTKKKIDSGKIVRVKVDEVKKTKNRFRLFSAKIIELPEVDSTDTLETLEQLASKTKKSLAAGMRWGLGETIGDLFEVESGLSFKPKGKPKGTKTKKGLYITDNIHGIAEIILKEDLDGFTIYGFEGDTLMQKNALYNIDVWKEQITEIMKTRRSDLRIGIKNEIIEMGNKPLQFEKIVDFVQKHYGETFADIFHSNDGKLMTWLRQQEDLLYHHPNKFSAREDVLEKDIEPKIVKAESKTGNFSIVQREDGNLDFIIDVNDKRNAWTIEIDDTEDIYNLFGKSGKFPAIVAKKIGKNKKTIDKGEITLGVQKDGYHEYRIDGDKFDTRVHLRVIPLDEQKRWLAWTGKKQRMLDMKEDENVWDITEDTYAHLEFPPEKDA